jgi:hypothetical protein
LCDLQTIALSFATNLQKGEVGICGCDGKKQYTGVFVWCETKCRVSFVRRRGMNESLGRPIVLRHGGTTSIHVHAKTIPIRLLLLRACCSVFLFIIYGFIASDSFRVVATDDMMVATIMESTSVWGTC